MSALCIDYGGDNMNYIPQIAKMFGVEIGEHFSINGHKCYFSEDDFKSGDYALMPDTLLGNMILSPQEFKVHKLPWKPKFGEDYYIPIPYGCGYETRKWSGSEVEKEIYQHGVVCATIEEAKDRATKMIEVCEDMNNNII